MTTFRKKSIFLITILFVSLITLSFWYIDLDGEYVYNRERKEYLSHLEARKEALHYDPATQYWYEIKYVELRRKTLIPFVYEYETISDIKKQLKGREREIQ